MLFRTRLANLYYFLRIREYEVAEPAITLIPLSIPQIVHQENRGILSISCDLQMAYCP